MAPDLKCVLCSILLRFDWFILLVYKSVECEKVRGLNNITAVLILSSYVHIGLSSVRLLAGICIRPVCV